MVWLASAAKPSATAVTALIALDVAEDAEDAEDAEPVAVSWLVMVSPRAALIRFAQRKLHDTMLAEDVVHNVLKAVISGGAKFGGRCALKSWLTAISKFKIVGSVRQRAGCDSPDPGSDEGGEGGGMSESVALRCTHPQLDEVAEQRQRLALVLHLINALTVSMRSVIELRMLQDRSTEDVCRALAISEDNLFVRLHRARKHLVC